MPMHASSVGNPNCRREVPPLPVLHASCVPNPNFKKETRTKHDPSAIKVQLFGPSNTEYPWYNRGLPYGIDESDAIALPNTWAAIWVKLSAIANLRNSIGMYRHFVLVVATSIPLYTGLAVLLTAGIQNRWLPSIVLAVILGFVELMALWRLYSSGAVYEVDLDQTIHDACQELSSELLSTTNYQFGIRARDWYTEFCAGQSRLVCCVALVRCSGFGTDALLPSTIGQETHDRDYCVCPGSPAVKTEPKGGTVELHEASLRTEQLK